MRLTGVWILLLCMGWVSLPSLGQETHAPASSKETWPVAMKGATV